MISQDREVLRGMPVNELMALLAGRTALTGNGGTTDVPVTVQDAIAQHRAAFQAFAAEGAKRPLDDTKTDAANFIEHAKLSAVFAAPVTNMADVAAKAEYLLNEVHEVADFFLEKNVVYTFLRSLLPRAAAVAGPDPMLDDVTAHRSWHAAYAAASFGDSEGEKAWLNANPNAAGTRLLEDPAMPTTTAGALAAIRFVIEDDGYVQKPNVAILRQALAFLEGRPVG